MKKYEKIQIVQGVSIDCYCTEAPDAFLDRHYKCLLTGIGKNKDHFSDFLNNIPEWNDGIIIFNLSTDELNDFYVDTSIPVLIVEKVEGVSFINGELPFSIISYVNAEWIFLLDTSEKVIMGGNQLDLEAGPLKDASFVSFHVFYTLDDINYYKHNLGEGIYKYRLFKKKYLMEVRNDPDRIVFFAAGIIHKTDKPEDKDFSLLIPLFKIDEIYFAPDGTIENAGKIYDENICKLLEEDLDKIYRYLENESVNQERIGLYTGLSGKILFFIQLYLMKKDEAILFKAYEYLDIVLESIQSKKNLSFSFCDGLAGFGWLISYLQEHCLIEIPDDYLDDLDNILFVEMKNFCNHFLFDQMHQAISIE